jgi:DUF917 family protein
MGNAVLEARQQNADAAEAVAELGHRRVLFRGKIEDLERRMVGSCA